MTRTITNNRTVYVGNLPGDVREREVEDLFYKYGRIVDIDLKLPPRPPGYAFVEFADVRDAEDAIKGRDGYDFDGNKLRVELAHGGRGSSRGSSYDRHNNHNSGVTRPTGVSRRSEYRVIVTGLPASASWQDLKDHMRRAGDVCFAQVFRDGNGAMGIVDYTNYDDMKYAIRKLDGTEFRNPFARGFIKIREHKDAGRSYSRSRSKSYSRSRSLSSGKSRSRSYSRSRSRSKTRRSYSRSFSRSPSKGRSKSRSLSKSKSRSRSRSKSPVKSLERKSRSVSPEKVENIDRSKSNGRSRSRSLSASPERNQANALVEATIEETNPSLKRSDSREKSCSPVRSPQPPSPDKFSTESPHASPTPNDPAH